MQRSRLRSNLFIVLLIVGLALLVSSLQLTRLGTWLEIALRWWPSVLIIIGLVKVVYGRHDEFVKALSLLGWGIVLQILLLGWMPTDMEHFWPFAFILAGLWLIIVQPGTFTRKVREQSASFSRRVYFGTSIITIEEPDFVRADVQVRFGMAELECPSGASSRESIELHVDVLMGNVVLLVPTHWSVSTSVRRSLAAVQDERVHKPAPALDAPDVHITGKLLFGALFIRNLP